MKKISFFKTAFTVQDGGIIEGYASVFNGIDSYNDTIESTAFDSVIKSGQQPLMFYGHKSWEIPIGTWLSMEVDSVGLKVRGQLNLEIRQAKDVYSALKFGSLNGLSIGFVISDDDIEIDENEVRHIKSMQELLEISIVNFPADNNARISDVKSEDIDVITDLRSAETFLRDLGMSKRNALHLISAIKSVVVSDLQQAEEKRKQEQELKQSQLDTILKRIYSFK